MPVDSGDFEKTLGFPLASSQLENIDTAMFSYLKDLNLHVNTSDGYKSVPVIWTTAERAFQSKSDSAIRDKNGSLILPLMTAERVGVAKSSAKKGSVQAALVAPFDEKGGVIPVGRRINQEKTSNFQNAASQRKKGHINFPRLKDKKIVYETAYIPLPIYVTVDYEITLRTEYQQQMNDLMSTFLVSPGGVGYILINNEGHRYEGFIQENFEHKNNLSSFTDEERKYETKIKIEVLGHIYEGESRPNVAIRENAVDFKIPRERIMTQDEVEREVGDYVGTTIVTNINK